EGSILDINSLDFVAAGTITSGGANTLTLDSGSNVLTLASNDTTITATGLTTITSSATLGVSATSFNLGAGSAATIGTISDDNLTLAPNGTGNLVLSSDFNTSVLVGNATTPAPLSVSGGIGSNASLVVNQENSGDLFAASASGVTKFAVGNNGTLRLYGSTSGYTGLLAPAIAGNNILTLPTGNGVSGQALVTDGLGTLSWTNVPTGFNPWDAAEGAIHPKSGTYDLLLGGNSTASAQFAVIGLSNGTPVATLSATTNSNGLVLDAANSSIQSLRNNTLTFGGSTTGNIVLNSGSDVVQFADNSIQFIGSAPIISSANTLTINAFTLGGQLSASANTISNVGTLTFGTNNISITGTTISTSGGNSNLTLQPNGTGDIFLASDDETGVFIGNATTPAPLSISGGIGGNSSLVVNQTNSGDLFAASASGTTRFRVQNTGELVIGDNASAFFATLNPATLTADRTLTIPNESGTICV
ncbi:MAG: hypothetical protein Q7T74_03140, partial [Candidatus Saccharibacteria bacterium]|nr:hypothetical protein [Candidatus Saccharibacteria bacterium]